MEKDSKYKVVARGVEFTLTRSQIEFNSPNYFTSCFSGNFREAQTHQLELYRDPDLFRIVLDYLCGYKVLPLNEKAIPPHMSPELALVNLRADASFYLLDGLVKECDAFIKPNPNQYSLVNRYIILGCTYSRYASTDIREQIDSALRNGVHHWRTYANKAQIDKGPLAKMETPGSFSGYDGFRKIGQIERLVAAKFPGFDQDRWRLVGWHMGADPQRASSYHECQLMVVLEDLHM